MSAICGVLPFREQRRHHLMCRDMLADQSRFGSHDQGLSSTAEISVGRALHRIVPEDGHDLQPTLGGGGRFLIVADARIDNREELLATLGSGGRKADQLSDAAIVVSAYERWREESFGQLVGAFAIAVWDAKRGKLILARDPTGQRPLHYYLEDRFFAFASTPSGLTALPEVAASPDEERLMRYMGGFVSDPNETFFRGVRQIQSGHVVSIGLDRVLRTRRYWHGAPKLLCLANSDDYIDAYRERLNQAVRSQLRGANGVVAAHLSGGLDSGAVTSTAARLLAPEGGRVLAFTAAPRVNYDGKVPRGRIGDESELAAQIAAGHMNVDHVVLRPSGERLLNVLGSDAAMAQEPIPLLCNNLWWRGINKAAHDRGARVLLLGEAGNITISAGGITQLSELVGQVAWLRWLREARALVSTEMVSWRGILASSFGPWMPASIWNGLNVAFLGTSTRLGPNSLIGPFWREQLEAGQVRVERRTRPPRNMREYRLQFMQRLSPGNLRKTALAASGVDVRDPTADRRVTEFCLSLPPELLLSGGLTRALARRALTDRLPPSVLHARLRGLQFIDWHEHISASEAANALEQVQDCEAVRRVVDVERMWEMIATWPSEGWERLSMVGEYRYAFLKGLSAAHFIWRASQPRVAPSADRIAQIHYRTPVQAS